jgi:hypothetical protein
LKAYIDDEGVIYFCGEYYMPGLEVWQHVPYMLRMEDIRKVTVAYGDPTIFDATMQQSNQPSTQGKAVERAKSINELYIEQGVELFSPFQGDRSDISFAGRLMLHWSNLDKREPSVKIVCRNYSERPQPGLHHWDCPNLLWELMRTRRVKLTSQQLLSRNTSEAIVDKENHARDAMKYLLMSHPEPAVKTMREKAREALQPLVEYEDLTSAYIRYLQMMEEQEEEEAKPIRLAHLTSIVASNGLNHINYEGVLRHRSKTRGSYGPVLSLSVRTNRTSVRPFCLILKVADPRPLSTAKPGLPAFPAESTVLYKKLYPESIRSDIRVVRLSLPITI